MQSSLSVPSSGNEHLQALLDSAGPFRRGELKTIDPDPPPLLAILTSAGAGESWHRLGSFLDHLLHVYRILKLWKAEDSVCLCGLFHSVYSNSYNNLAIFDPDTDRDTVRGHVGGAAERLIHMFCIIPRQPLIHDDLLFQYTESELIEHLDRSEVSLRSAKERRLFNEEEDWRVIHIKTGEKVHISRRVIGVFLLVTMADFSDQFFGYQDVLYNNLNGRLEFSGNYPQTLWPGNGKPGLWMNSISRMAAIYTLIAREEEILMEARKREGHYGLSLERDEDIELVIPPVFDNCTKILDARAQIVARDLYWDKRKG